MNLMLELLWNLEDAPFHNSVIWLILFMYKLLNCCGFPECFDKYIYSWALELCTFTNWVFVTELKYRARVQKVGFYHISSRIVQFCCFFFRVGLYTWKSQLQRSYLCWYYFLDLKLFFIHPFTSLLLFLLLLVHTC